MNQASNLETRTSFGILVDNETGDEVWVPANDDSTQWEVSGSSQTSNRSRQVIDWREEPDSTVNKSFEHFEADVDRYFSELNGGHAQHSNTRIKQLVKQILESSDPFKRIRTIVEYCCLRPTQDRIIKGAYLLARVPKQVVEFIRKKDDRTFGTPRPFYSEPPAPVTGSPIPRHSRYWLYTQIPSLINDSQNRSPFVELLHDWLKDTDSGIREGSAITLGEVGDQSTIARLHEALEAERDASVRDAIQDSVRDLTTG